MAKILEAKHVSVVYSIRKGLFSRAEILALNDVDFDVDENASISIVGESGSGKTTLVGYWLAFNYPLKVPYSSMARM